MFNCDHFFMLNDEKYFNDAITEKISYCRKQMKKLQTE